MDRRQFINTLTVLTATAVLDPERLLWVPGQKTIFLPKESIFDVGTIYYRDGYVYERVRIAGGGRDVWIPWKSGIARKGMRQSLNNLYRAGPLSTTWIPDASWQRVDQSLISREYLHELLSCLPSGVSA